MFQKKNRSINIVMLGASLKQKGGIASVESLIMKHMTPEIKIRHISSHEEGSIPHKLNVYKKCLIAFIKVLLLQNIDLVHIHLSERGSTVRKLILIAICLVFNKPVIMHAHGAEFHIFYTKVNTLYRILICLMFRRCKRFIVLSKSWKKFYIRRLSLKKEQVYVLPNSVEIPTVVPRRKNNKIITFVFVGRIGHRKGAFDLIKAYGKLTDSQRKRSRLIFAGDGDVDYGQRMTQKLSLTNGITFLGWIDEDKRNKLFTNSDVFTLPSYNEGLPMAIIEAMGWGLPVITTNVGGIPEVVMTQINGFLICPGDTQKLSDAMKLMIEKTKMRKRLGNAARMTAERYDIKDYCEQLAGVYYSILC